MKRSWHKIENKEKLQRLCQKKRMAEQASTKTCLNDHPYSQREITLDYGSNALFRIWVCFNAFDFRVFSLLLALFCLYSRYFAFDFRVFLLLLALSRIWLSRFFAFICVISHLTLAFFSHLYALFRLYSRYNAFQFRVISHLFAFLRLSFALLRLWCNIFFLEWHY